MKSSRCFPSPYPSLLLLNTLHTQENNYNPRKGFKNHEEDWRSSLQEALGKEYVLISAQGLGQMFLHVYARNTPEVLNLIDVGQVDKATEATGIAGVVANKGGSCVALFLNGVSCAFVSAHLAAHTTETKRRNADVIEILKGIRFKGDYGVDIASNFSHIFWMGDLNYRLDLGGDEKEPDKAKFAEMLQMIDEEKWDTLMQTDQLLKCMEKKEVFVGFNDCPPAFRPTFKVERDAVKPAYNEKRTPSYCDRVLWRSQPSLAPQVRLISFQSAEVVTSSDHKPVMASFEVLINEVPPATDDKLGPATLVFPELHATNIPAGDVGNTSDPFVRFLSPYVNKVRCCVFG
jgi:hypothetical protein